MLELRAPTVSAVIAICRREAADAMICSFERTWCAECAQTLGVCPNCGGNFTPRPIRPVAALLDSSTIRRRRSAR
jgi:uncharacterized protein